MTPRSQASTLNASAYAANAQVPVEPGPADATPSAPPSAEVHNMSPDPWTVDPDPWAQWLHDQGPAEQPPHLQTPSQSMPTSFTAPGASGQQALQPRQVEWAMPGLGRVGPRISFGEMLGYNSAPASQLPPASATWPTPGWFNQHQSVLQQVREGVEAQATTPARTMAVVQPTAAGSIHALPALMQQHLNAPVGTAPASRDSALTVTAFCHVWQCSISCYDHTFRQPCAVNVWPDSCIATKPWPTGFRSICSFGAQVAGFTASPSVVSWACHIMYHLRGRVPAQRPHLQIAVWTHIPLCVCRRAGPPQWWRI